MLTAVQIEPGYRTHMNRYFDGVEVEPGYRMPMQQPLGAVIGPGYRMPMNQFLAAPSPAPADHGLFIKDLWFGADDAAPSIMPGVLSLIASAALVGGLLFLIKKA
jgi:hypothetical protein